MQLRKHYSVKFILFLFLFYLKNFFLKKKKKWKGLLIVTQEVPMVVSTREDPVLVSTRKKRLAFSPTDAREEY